MAGRFPALLGNLQHLLTLVRVGLQFVLSRQPVQLLLSSLLLGDQLFFFVSECLQTFCQRLQRLGG